VGSGVDAEVVVKVAAASSSTRLMVVVSSGCGVRVVDSELSASGAAVCERL
jgi:uncharacterized metal-binding protein